MIAPGERGLLRRAARATRRSSPRSGWARSRYRQGADRHAPHLLLGLLRGAAGPGDILAEIGERAEDIDVARAEEAHDARGRAHEADPGRGGLRRGAPRLRPRRDAPGGRAQATRAPDAASAPAARGRAMIRAGPRRSFRYRLLIQSLVGARAQGPLPRQRPRLLLELRQPAAAAPHLRARLHRNPARSRARRSIEPYFLFLFCGILPWTWFQASLARVVGRADRGRQPDQEGAVPGRGAAGGHRARQPRPLPARPADPARSSWPATGTLCADARCSCRCPSWCSSSSPSGLALFVSALTVHFRDIQSILGHLLHLWFFATPVLYCYGDLPGALRDRPAPQPDDPRDRVATSRCCSTAASTTGAAWSSAARGRGRWPSPSGAFLFDRLRDTLAEEV